MGIELGGKPLSKNLLKFIHELARHGLRSQVLALLKDFQDQAILEFLKASLHLLRGFVRNTDAVQELLHFDHQPLRLCHGWGHLFGQDSSGITGPNQLL